MIVLHQTSTLVSFSRVIGPLVCKFCKSISIRITIYREAKLNGADAVSFVAVKHILENFDNFGYSSSLTQ